MNKLLIVANRNRFNSYFFGQSVRNQHGFALVTAIVMLVILSLLGLVGVKWASQDIQRTSKYNKTREAFYLAEAGLQKAMNLLNYDADGSSPGTEIANGGMTEVLTNFSSNNSAQLTNFSIANGTYNVTVQDNNDNDGDTSADADNTIILTSVGTRDGISKTLQALVNRSVYSPKHAIVTGEDLTINGNPTVQGTHGSVHSNANIIHTSNNIEDGMYAVGTCDSPCVSGADAETLPNVTVLDYKPYADFILKNDGTITDSNGNVITPSAYGLENWTFVTVGSFTGWQVIGTSANAMFYAEDNVKVQGTGGTTVNMTIISEGNIIITGNVDIQNYKNSSHPKDIQNLLFIAEDDIDFNGNLTQAIDGIIIAKEQASLTGDVELTGYALALGADNSSSTVTSNDISGSFQITYNNTAGPFLSDTVKIISWKEVG